jgi:hypothetical protein
VVVEVGTHIGSLLVPLARMLGPAGTLFGFEPQPTLYQMCSANVALNGLSNVRLFHAAAGDTQQSTTATIAVYNADDLRNLGGGKLNHVRAPSSSMFVFEPLRPQVAPPTHSVFNDVFNLACSSKWYFGNNSHCAWSTLFLFSAQEVAEAKAPCALVGS